MPIDTDPCVTDFQNFWKQFVNPRCSWLDILQEAWVSEHGWAEGKIEFKNVPFVLAP